MSCAVERDLHWPAGTLVVLSAIVLFFLRTGDHQAADGHAPGANELKVASGLGCPRTIRGTVLKLILDAAKKTLALRVSNRKLEKKWLEPKWLKKFEQKNMEDDFSRKDVSLHTNNLLFHMYVDFYVKR